MSIQVDLRQPSFPDFCAVTAAVERLATTSLPQERGAVYTRREVVDFLLDLAGYRSDQALHRKRLLEPSFGAGDFLLPAVDRLLDAWAASDDKREPFEVLGACVRAVELHRETFEATRDKLVLRLLGAGMTRPTASAIADSWLVNGDFLLADLPGSFDVVVGNPPYLRQEMIPAVLLAEYRKRYDTLFDRADLYVPFIERALRLLLPGGAVGFICADRWMKNRYGGPLRQLVAEGFHLKVYVDMSDTPAFHSEVTAYPAITVIVREQPGVTRIAARPEINGKALGDLAVQLLALGNPESGSGVRELCGVTSGAEPWVLTGADHLSVVRRLEAQLPNLEAAGCSVGIGVATGADGAFIGLLEELDVEPDRKLPLVMTRDISSGQVQWRGFGVINPFADTGGLVDLSQYPRLAKYLEARKDLIANRHCARKSPASWYRTIDRISPELAKRPKLLIPDIKGESHVVYEEGVLYPHHNLYHVTSNEWDLRALQAVLLSSVTRLFVATYSTKMRGGFLRFQAQYLRRIRIPKWEHVDGAMRRSLIAAATAQDLPACNRAAFELYGLSDAEQVAMGGCLGREAKR